MRSISDLDYRYRPISKERKAKLSEIHRKRWGAPEGYCTVRGVHVPFEHRPPVRYFSDYVATNYGEDQARKRTQALADSHWQGMDDLWSLYQERRDIALTREAIRKAEWEIVRGN